MAKLSLFLGYFSFEFKRVAATYLVSINACPNTQLPLRKPYLYTLNVRSMGVILPSKIIS